MFVRHNRYKIEIDRIFNWRGRLLQLEEEVGENITTIVDEAVKAVLKET